MKYLVYYNDYADIIEVNKTRPSKYAPDVGFDNSDGIYYAVIEADNEEQAVHKALAAFLDIANARVEACKASFERVKNKFIEVVR